MWARPLLRPSALRASRRTRERRFWPSGLVLDRGCQATVALFPHVTHVAVGRGLSGQPLFPPGETLCRESG